MNRIRCRAVIALFTVALALGQLLSTAYAREPASVKIQPQATLVADGQAVEVSVKVACDPASGEVLESFVYVVQDGNQSAFAAIPIVCDNNHHLSVIRVALLPESPLLYRGAARASAFVLLLDPLSGATVSGEDTRQIKIR